MFRFAPAAAMALAASQIIYFLCGSVWHLTGRVTGAAAWLAGVLVSYLVSRWAWERRGRPRLLAETLPFVAISVATGAVLIEASNRGYLAARALGLHGWAFHLATQGFYLATNVLTFIGRFLIFNFVLFAERSAGPAGPSPAGIALPRRRMAGGLWRPAPVFADRSTGPGSAGRQGTTAPRRGLARGLWRLALEFAKFSVVWAGAWMVAGKEAIELSLQAGAEPQTATVAALAAMTAVSFAGNRYWTFRHRARTTVGREGLLYLLLTVAGLVIEIGCLRLAVGVLGPHSGLPYGPGAVTAFALAVLFRYWSCRTWVWRSTWSHLSHTGQIAAQ
jgi:putative flippase GtrA